MQKVSEAASLERTKKTDSITCQDTGDDSEGKLELHDVGEEWVRNSGGFFCFPVRYISDLALSRFCWEMRDLFHLQIRPFPRLSLTRTKVDQDNDILSFLGAQSAVPGTPCSFLGLLHFRTGSP